MLSQLNKCIPQMGKRKFSSPEQSLDTDSGSDFCASDDQFDVPCNSKTRKKSTSRPSKKRTRHDGANDVSGALPIYSSHAKSIHVMDAADVSSIRTALVQWYETVHLLREMPWRKQHNPTLDHEQRAQRAYEVKICSAAILGSFTKPIYFVAGVDI
jgi:A/G-specific adenine glycosylase